MRIGLNVPLFAHGQALCLDDLIRRVADLAQLGFSTAWFAYYVGFDVLTLIALIGRVVKGIELGTAVVPIQPRHPMVMAQQAITAQAAVGGRFTLGIGLSHPGVVENRWGYHIDRPLEYMREYLQILQPLLRGEPVAFKGQLLSGAGRLAIPETPQSGVLLGALGPRMLQLAGQHTDGAVTWMVGPRTLETHIAPAIQRAARASGRPEPRIVVGLPVCVTDDAASARAWARRAFARYGQLPSYRAMLDREGVAGPADVAIVGSEAAVQRQLLAFERGGATDANVSLFGSSDEQARGLAWLSVLALEGVRGR